MFIDSDIGFEPEQFARLFRLDRDFAAAMYPIKEIDWGRIPDRQARGESLDATGLNYVGAPCRGQALRVEDGFATADYVGTGFMLIKRRVLERMIAAVRTRQTADALDREYRVVPDLAPGGDAAHILAASGWPRHKGTVLVIGHQPTLGETTSLLLWGESRPFSIKKGGVIWLTNRVRAEQTQVLLKAALTPEMV
jgi:phosphohistidine phosphatase SixA